jgi:hypothetical protein
MPKDRFYGLDNDHRIAILNGNISDIPENVLPLAMEWLENLKIAQGGKLQQVKTEELENNGED